MTQVVTERSAQVPDTQVKTTINDIVIKVATANGSGSQSANLILLRSIFGMGIPVSGKNMFPSNIEGLPTWFTIRANDNGWLAQRNLTDVVVAMNKDTVVNDIAELRPGGLLILNESLKAHLNREDILVYTVPFSTIVKEVCDITRLRKKIANVLYVGVVARLLGIDMEEVTAAVEQQFGSKPKAAEMNRNAAELGYSWATENLDSQDRFTLQRSNKTEGKIIIEGNEATAMGMLFGGVTVSAWYPITPSSSVCEYLTTYLARYRHDPETDKATYAIVQAEDEIASIGMVLGAGWAGARSFTATSGPGISLMAEMAGLSYFAEIPAVIVDVQRMGPSTGLPTRTCQADIMSAYHLSHGDCNHVLLLPGSVQECYEFAMESLDLAQQLQTLVFLMTDLDMGMNKWMADPFEPPTKPIQRGKVLTAEDLERLGGFERYADVDGDGIPYRTLPGTPNPKAAYFTRGTGHTTAAEYSEKKEDWQNNIDRLSLKFETARDLVPKPVLDEVDGAKIGLIAYGSTDAAMSEARQKLSETFDITTSYLRMRALPFHSDVRDYIERYDRIYVIDQNRDRQMATILRGELPELAAKIGSIRHYDGMPIDADSIVQHVVDQES